ncbi:MAG TPA: polynucleotide adenylyltransferase PcnB [Limnobacter sp.]|uniref:polynucleotide adenylyltransferase PcnB n=1 Tax=Limnobacter sp. TaxID=2003368 RepID=UPI002ED7B22A
MIRKFFKRLLAKPTLSKDIPGKQSHTHLNHGGKTPSAYGVHKPKVWTLAEHKIDRRLVSHNAIRVCETLQAKGYKAFVVGGAVRDLVLGMRPKDFDVATDASPEQVQRLFRRARIIGRRFQIVHVMFGPETIETSTFRALASSSSEVDEHGRVLRDNEFGRQDEDATRRDFTVNALYYDPSTETVWDYHHGMEDLRAKTLRMIGEPSQRYREDPVRMLRVVRFAAKLNFTIEPATYAPIADLADLLKNVPASRLFDEMLKLLMSGSALACLKGLRKAGLHHGVFPLLDAIMDQERGEAFLAEALSRTDQRVKDGKPLSPGFLFACLLWHLVLENWEKKVERGEVKFPALFAAMDEVLAEQAERTAIPRRLTGDMREIWAFQPRFEKRAGKAPFRMLEQQKFRAALDFYELRAETGDADPEVARWWRIFSDGESNNRQHLMDQLRETPAGRAEAAPKKKRRRKRKPNGNASTGAANSGQQAGE